MRSDATTVEAYLATLPEDRRQAIAALRCHLLRYLPEGYAETMNWGMICYEVPLAIEPRTYNGKPLMYAALASQKNHMALYLCGLNCIGGLEKEFVSRWRGRKLDMGKACIRFKHLEDLDLTLIGETLAAVSVDKFVKASKRA